MKSCDRGHLQTTACFNDDPGRFQTSGVLDGISDAFMVIGKLTYPFGITDRHVQDILGNVHTDTYSFRGVF